MRIWNIITESGSVIYYHGTPSNSLTPTITDMRPLSHFGSRQAAEHRILTKFLENKNLMGLRSASSMIAGTIFPVHIAMSNPLRIEDSRDNRMHGYPLVDHLHYDLHVLTSEDREKVFKSRCDPTAIVSMLRSKGYDGLLYRNLVEDMGHDSVMIFSSDQVTPAGPPQRFFKTY